MVSPEPRSAAADVLSAILSRASEMQLDQQSLARMAGVAPETVSRAKARGTADLAVLNKLARVVLGRVCFQPLDAPQPSAPLRSATRALSWSNANASDTVLIRKALASGAFTNILQAAAEFGIGRLRAELQAIQADEIDALPAREANYLNLRLANIERGFELALKDKLGI